jgi:hypothetical protein
LSCSCCVAVRCLPLFPSPHSGKPKKAQAGPSRHAPRLPAVSIGTIFLHLCGQRWKKAEAFPSAPQSRSDPEQCPTRQKRPFLACHPRIRFCEKDPFDPPSAWHFRPRYALWTEGCKMVYQQAFSHILFSKSCEKCFASAGSSRLRFADSTRGNPSWQRRNFGETAAS